MIIVNFIGARSRGLWTRLVAFFRRRTNRIQGSLEIHQHHFRAEVPPTRAAAYFLQHLGQPGDMTIVFIDVDGMVLVPGEARRQDPRKLVTLAVPYLFGPMIVQENGVVRLEAW